MRDYRVRLNAVGFKLMRAGVEEVLRLARHRGTADTDGTSRGGNQLLHSCPKSPVLRMQVFRLYDRRNQEITLHVLLYSEKSIQSCMNTHLQRGSVSQWWEWRRVRTDFGRS